ncbi:tRNA 2-thiocytidine biosynthesis protein TtcA [Desulfosarcina cetonica]|uniref:tRNA lysidine(34) synthetase n=1 Tax=Desulfosarcina cetonica TaxID=90730 RepID=UPI0006CF97D0|nr:ATP-binding protein [Desulfosarcina cetonica]VTR64821.1 tRNA 2-thiocytidine biosynthesis protein TtcA [Desulfosarcina cetonica]
MPRYNYTYKAINGLVGKAIHRYDMIADGDRITVGLSGGKDSLSLLWTLAERRKRVRVRYELLPVYIDPGFAGGFGAELADTCRQMGFSLTIEKTDHGLVAHSPVNRENPCFLCARLRRKRLFEIADQLGSNKLALGHNKDDIIETFFLNVCYAGEISTMVPRQDFFGGRFSVIRPLAMVEEKNIRRFAADQQIPTFTNPCPSAGVTKRSEIKTMLDGLYRTNRKIKGNIYRALSHVKMEYLLK